jgi:hypothetical protein
VKSIIERERRSSFHDHERRRLTRLQHPERLLDAGTLHVFRREPGVLDYFDELPAPPLALCDDCAPLRLKSRAAACLLVGAHPDVT